MAGVMHIGGRHSPLQWCAAALAVLGSLASYFDEDPEKPQKRTRVRKRSKKVESSSSESEPESEISTYHITSALAPNAGYTGVSKPMDDHSTVAELKGCFVTSMSVNVAF